MGKPAVTIGRKEEAGLVGRTGREEGVPTEQSWPVTLVAAVAAIQNCPV